MDASISMPGRVVSSNPGESMRVMGSLPCLNCQPWHTAVPIENISISNSL